MNQPIAPQQQSGAQSQAAPAVTQANTQSYAAPITNPMAPNQQAAPSVAPTAQPAAPAVAKTYMTREEYINKFGDDAGFLEPSAWEAKKRAREQNYNPNDVTMRRLEQQVGQMAQMLNGFMQQSTTKDLTSQYADLYEQQQDALKAGNVPLANSLEQQKLQIAVRMGGNAAPTQQDQQNMNPQQQADKMAANTFLQSTDWAPDPMKMDQARAIYAHLNSTRPDLSEVQKVIEVDKRIKSMGNYTQPGVMPSQTVIPNPPQQQFGNGEKNFANLPEAAKMGYDQLKGYRSDINPEIYAKNWYKRNGQ